VFAIVLFAGCDRRETAAPAASPAGSAGTTAPATQPLAQNSFIMIDQRRVGFPPAMLRVRDRGESLAAVLYSDDPRSALDDDYAGNSFYFDMDLDIADVTELGTARWQFRASESERRATTSGIFLEGRKYHLQPADVAVEFTPAGSVVKVWLAGTFYRFSSADDAQPGQVVRVQAELSAELSAKHP